MSAHHRLRPVRTEFSPPERTPVFLGPGASSISSHRQPSLARRDTGRGGVTIVPFALLAFLLVLVVVAVLFAVFFVVRRWL
jgi:hypothetical protein